MMGVPGAIGIDVAGASASWELLVAAKMRRDAPREAPRAGIQRGGVRGARVGRRGVKVGAGARGARREAEKRGVEVTVA